MHSHMNQLDGITTGNNMNLLHTTTIHGYYIVWIAYNTMNILMTGTGVVALTTNKLSR